MSAGRPSDYDPKYIDEMLEFFSNWESYRLVEEEIISSGRKVVIKKEKPNVPPTLNKYAIKLGVDRSTLKRWADAHPEFCLTYDACKAIQEEFVTDRGLLGEYNSAITKMMLVNHSGLKDKVEMESSSVSTIQINIDMDDNNL